MNTLRSIALLVLAGAAPLGAHADSIPAGTVATSPADSAAGSPDLYAITRGLAFLRQDDFTPAPANAIFASGANPVGDAVRSLRPFTLAGETTDMAESDVVEPVSDSGIPAPEPAGLFLLGSGAFATALTIRYRLFTL